MAKVNGSFKIDISKTADLAPPALECTWEVEFDGDPEYEKILIAYFKKNYEEGLKKVMGDQAKNFGVPLASMQKEIDGMRNQVSAIADQTDPVKIQALLAAFNAKYKVSLPDQVASYNSYLSKAVDNIKNQQMAIYAKKFEEEAFAYARKSIKRDARNKKIRHVAGVVLRGLLVLSVAAAGIAAIVLTFGTAGIVFAAIAAASAGLGGVSALGKTAKGIYDIRDLERRSIDLLAKDVAGMTGSLNGVETQLKGIAKHVNDVSTYYSQRRAETAKLDAEMKSVEAALTKVKTETDRLKNGLPKVYAAQEAKVKKATESFNKAKAAHESSSKRDNEIKAVLVNASAVLGDLNKIPFQKAKGMADGLSRIDFKDADTYLSLVDSLGGLSNAVGGIGMGKTAK